MNYLVIEYKNDKQLMYFYEQFEDENPLLRVSSHFKNKHIEIIPTNAITKFQAIEQFKIES